MRRSAFRLLLHVRCFSKPPGPCETKLARNLDFVRIHEYRGCWAAVCRRRMRRRTTESKCKTMKTSTNRSFDVRSARPSRAAVRSLKVAERVDALVYACPDGTADVERVRAGVRVAARDTDHGIADYWSLASGKAPLLNAAQELVLAKQIRAGSRSAREAMMNANVRLVASVVRRYVGRGMPLEDLMQEGIIGLLRAVEKYDHTRGYRFSTYATYWIRQAVTRSLANQGRSIRLPAHVVDAHGRLSRLQDELFGELGRAPSCKELAERAGMTEVRLSQLLRCAAEPISLDAPIGAEGDARIGDLISTDEEASPVDRAFDSLVTREINSALECLTDRERDIIVLRFGLNDEEPHTLEQAGHRLRITRERARQIEARALGKLRDTDVKARLLAAID